MSNTAAFRAHVLQHLGSLDDGVVAILTAHLVPYIGTQQDENRVYVDLYIRSELFSGFASLTPADPDQHVRALHAAMPAAMRQPFPGDPQHLTPQVMRQRICRFALTLIKSFKM